MPRAKRAPGKLAARVKQVKTFSREMKDKAKEEARDFTVAYRDAVSGPKLDAGYKKSARIARRVTKKAAKGKIGEYKGESIDLSRKRKAVKQIASSMNTSLTGRALKKNAKTKYAQIKEREKQKANPKYAQRQMENRQYDAQAANPIRTTSSGQLSAKQRQMVCPQTGTGGASGCLTQNSPGGKKSMSKKTKTPTVRKSTKTTAVKKAAPRKK
jgi:hypothetical protein